MRIKFDIEKKCSLEIAIKLSLQRALVGDVSSNLRMIAFDRNQNEKKIFLYFYFDGEIIEKCISLDSSQKLPKQNYIVYMKKE